MKARLVRIGNSRGVRIPKPLIEQAGLTEDVELVVREGEIVITRIASTRAGWATAGEELAAREEDQLIGTPVSTRFDLEEWEW
ncbi:MAG: AbrB/MazE/SpoVT family DNA-binding domain-containing protein [Acidobacteria bacterium]|nr:AbrB/MazE/SpoVT family DNA-binding domain-containing protein [Acidobacteriota bacterium]